jgi:glycogen debranching enzyme
MIDSQELRKQIPDFHPYPYEEVISVTYVDVTLPDRHLSAAKAIMTLTAASTLDQIGLHGPSNAANASETNPDQEDLNLYMAFFPRDAHIVAGFLHDRFPQLTEATIAEAIRFTGVRDNLHSVGLKDEQEVGKIPHEIRNSESDAIAQRLSKERDWGWPYYGAIDTTGKNIVAINRVVTEKGLEFLDTTYVGLDGQDHTYLDALGLHLNWVRKRMGLNPDGLVESLWLNPKHHANQAWTDSPDSFHHANGTWAIHQPEKNWGVAALEVQAEIYDALVSSIITYSLLADQMTGQRLTFFEDEITDLVQRAGQLRQTILDKFWVDDPAHFGGFFARGTDRDANGYLRPLAIRSSDMGHLLNSNLLDSDDPEIVYKREATIRNIFSPEMLCTNGIRTLSSDSVRYWPERYHDGNSWPWTTYYTALGLQRHGYYGLAYELKKRAFSVYEQTKILPEYATGRNNSNDKIINKKVVIHDASLTAEPTHQISQPPQEVQAWTAAAILAMKYEEGKRVSARLYPHRNFTVLPSAAPNPDKRAFETEILSALQG